MKRVRAALASLAVLATACNVRTAGAPTGDVTLHVTFDDAQHLVPGHSVRVADVQVGSVVEVALDADYRARVRVSIVDSRPIPAGTVATLSQTSLLGENYVRLTFPESFDPVEGPWLGDEAELTSGGADPSLEAVTAQAIDVLGAVEGGDLAVIVDALATGTAGRGEMLHRIIGQLAVVGQTFAGQSESLGTAVDGLGRLGADLATDTAGLDQLLVDLGAATATLADQRARFVEATSALVELAGTLDEALLTPHGEDLDRLLSQLDDIGVVLADERGTIGTLLRNLAELAVRAPRAGDDNGSIYLFGWVTELRLPGGGAATLARRGPDALTAMLEPPS